MEQHSENPYLSVSHCTKFVMQSLFGCLYALIMYYWLLTVWVCVCVRVCGCVCVVCDREREREKERELGSYVNFEKGKKKKRYEQIDIKCWITKNM